MECITNDLCCRQQRCMMPQSSRGEKSNDAPEKTFPHATFLTVVSIALVAYVNSTKGDFVHDDIPAIVKNPDVNGQNGKWVQIFSNDFWGEPMASLRSHKSYRPLTILLFR